MSHIEKKICELLGNGEECVLATIISQAGSTPRLPGTKMIIRAGGQIIGTIGGGLVEAAVIKAAPEIMDTGGARIRSFDLNHANMDDSMDMICGGALEILLEPLFPDGNHRPMFEILVERARKGLKSILAIDISHVGSNGEGAVRSLFGEDGARSGAELPESVMEALMEKGVKERSPTLVTVEGRRFLVEPLFSAGTVFLFGAGHVSLAVARLTRMVDFRTVVLDDRIEFANPDRFPGADEVIVLDNFANAMEGLPIGADSYIVILTRGHSYDKTVLAQALKTPAGYIGMIGSSRKRNTIYSKLLEQGFTEEDLGRVHSPIGLSIGAQTPEEIAVSIIGELIAERAGMPTPV